MNFKESNVKKPLSSSMKKTSKKVETPCNISYRLGSSMLKRTISTDGMESVCVNSNQAVKPSTLSKLQCDFTYNEYLRALMESELIGNQIKEQKKILEGQILLQERNNCKKTEELQLIKEDIDLLSMKEEVIKRINTLEKKISIIKQIYERSDTVNQLEKLYSHFIDVSGTLILKNVQPINTPEEQKNLIDSIKKLHDISQKVIDNIKDFDGVHNVAIEIVKLTEMITRINNHQALINGLANEGIADLIKEMSDKFAEQYI